ncbi:unnamed protein product [Amoebophrya sp. A120]|nr:unnamed protein product [Amoebophrya sp. A120]|eukprot:GSA120T00000986001.1
MNANSDENQSLTKKRNRPKEQEDPLLKRKQQNKEERSAKIRQKLRSVGEEDEERLPIPGASGQQHPPKGIYSGGQQQRPLTGTRNNKRPGSKTPTSSRAGSKGAASSASSAINRNAEHGGDGQHHVDLQLEQPDRDAGSLVVEIASPQELLHGDSQLLFLGAGEQDFQGNQEQRASAAAPEDGDTNNNEIFLFEGHHNAPEPDDSSSAHQNEGDPDDGPGDVNADDEEREDIKGEDDDSNEDDVVQQKNKKPTSGSGDEDETEQAQDGSPSPTADGVTKEKKKKSKDAGNDELGSGDEEDEEDPDDENITPDGKKKERIQLEKDKKAVVQKFKAEVKKLIDCTMNETANLFHRTLVNRKNTLLHSLKTSHELEHEELLDFREQYELCYNECDKLETLNLELGANLLPDLYEQISDLTSDRTFLLMAIKQYFDGKMLESIDLYEMEKKMETENSTSKTLDDKDGNNKSTGEAEEDAEASKLNKLILENRVLKKVLWNLGPANMDIEAQRANIMQARTTRIIMRTGRGMGGAEQDMISSGLYYNQNHNHRGTSSPANNLSQTIKHETGRGGVRTSTSVQLSPTSSNSSPRTGGGNFYQGQQLQRLPRTRATTTTSTATQTDHRVLNASLLQSESLLQLAHEYEKRVKANKQVSAKKIQTLLRHTEEEKAKHTALFTNLVQRILAANSADNNQPNPAFVDSVTSHLLQCKQLQQQFGGGGAS